MPDLRSALEKAMSSWDDEAKTPTTPTTMTTPTPAPSPIQAFIATSLPAARSTGVSVALFKYVHANPYAPLREVVHAMTTQGFNPASISSLVTQLVRRGYISRDKDDKLSALRNEYVVGHVGRKPGTKIVKAAPQPIKKAPIQIRRPLLPTAAENGLAALHAAPAHTSSPAPHIDYLLQNLNVGQAHALYLKLHKMFGG